MTSRNTNTKRNPNPRNNNNKTGVSSNSTPAALRTAPTSSATNPLTLTSPVPDFTFDNPRSHKDLVDQDEGEFAGILYDTILYERAVHRLETLKKYDFPVQYEELAHDFLTAYRLCLEPKFLAQPNLARYATYLLKSKLLTGKGVRAYAKDHGGSYEIFPSLDQIFDDFGNGEVDEIDEDDLSDYDEVDHGFEQKQKNVGYQGPKLSQRQGLQSHQDMFASDYFAVYKHSQDMIAMIVAHLRKRVWYHNGSGGEIVDIRNMGADKVPRRRTDDSAPSAEVEGGDGIEGNAGLKGIKGVKKYTRRFNGRIRRRNYERNLERNRDNVVGGATNFLGMHAEPPTDYSESESESSFGGGAGGMKGVGSGQNAEDMKRIEEAIARMVSMSLVDYTGSAKRKVQWLPLGRSEALYDWNGVSKELRLIDLPAEDADPSFYGCLTRDIMNKYKSLVPPPDLMERHAQLTSTLTKLISDAFPDEDLKVEPFGDADFCITGAKVHDHDHPLNDMNHIGHILKTKGHMEQVQCISDALVPIVKFYDPVSRLECDLNTGNTLGVINSGLIRIYTTIDERVKPFLYMVKAICKAQGINDAKSGYLSSYALTWMGIVFLQQEGYLKSTGTSFKPVLPRLQQQPFERMTEVTLRLNHNLPNSQTITSTPSLINSKSSDMVHCRFDTNKDGRHTGTGHANSKSLARLLIEFFEFFSRRFFYAEMAIHVARAQFLPKTSDLEGAMTIVE
ncbi:hypothetical protein EC957_000223 [Mortierella hygrophila]|uniref:polynucleotide adenylyltransferase n=1 Tax=Mortierella hygrophila TaxID=979708 RepID=A0A9P6K7Y4_9FUNG|nr:hypothetical protein EC957_000223 [Mortierella hygrophila]